MLFSFYFEWKTKMTVDTRTPGTQDSVQFSSISAMWTDL